MVLINNYFASELLEFTLHKSATAKISALIEEGRLLVWKNLAANQNAMIWTHSAVFLSLREY